MKLQTSSKSSMYSVKPHIKKGYYPGKLIKVSEFKNKEGSPIVGKYGLQLIFEFAIYKKNPETDEPIEPLTFVAEGVKEPIPITISKFTYHMYKSMDSDKKWIDGEYHTAITPNSAITKTLQALGWTFSEEGVDPDDYLNNWVELNIDDFTQGEGKDAYTASTIKDIGPYQGPEISKEIPDVTPGTSQKIEKQINHNDVIEKESVENKSISNRDEEIKKRKDNIENLKKLKDEGSLSQKGMDQAVESLQAEIRELEKI